MKLTSLLLLLSLFPTITFSMQDGKWTPWNSPAIWNPQEIAQYQQEMARQERYKEVCEFLRHIPEHYETMRKNVQENPEFYTRERFIEFSQYHVNILKQIEREYGWPSETHFEADCVLGAYLIAQHADHDLEFQEKTLKVLGKRTNLLARNYYAYLVDRICLNKGQPQVYGTQLDKDGLLYHILIPSEELTYHNKVTHLKIINQRRESAGLCLLQDSMEYLTHLHNLGLPVTDLSPSALPSQ